jgi:uncharacterized protein
MGTNRWLFFRDRDSSRCGQSYRGHDSGVAGPGGVPLLVRPLLLPLAAIALVVPGCAPETAPAQISRVAGPKATAEVPVPEPRRVQVALNPVQARILVGAKDQLSWGTVYDGAYVRIPYPGGDVPREQGVCTDVVVRALRNADIDLQRLIHEDMRRAWGEYPRYAGLSRPDPNIDHRRVPNQIRFLKRHGRDLGTSLREWLPGDFVFWKLDGGLDHVGVLSDLLGASGDPCVIHNLGGVREEDVLRRWKIVGHYRYPP